MLSFVLCWRGWQSCASLQALSSTTEASARGIPLESPRQIENTVPQTQIVFFLFLVRCPSTLARFGCLFVRTLLGLPGRLCARQSTSNLDCMSIWGCPKIGRYFLGVLIIGDITYWFACLLFPKTIASCWCCVAAAHLNMRTEPRYPKHFIDFELRV